MPAFSKRAKAPLSSLRLLVPPLRLLSAFLWKVTEQRLIRYYTRLEEFISVVLEMVPDLLSAKERIELLLGLRARFVVELCHDQPSVTLQMLQPHLDRIRWIAESAPIDKSGDQTAEVAVGNFANLIQNLLQNSRHRELFFQDIYTLHYGPTYDEALQLLVWEFFSRLDTLIPVPSFDQVASWFDEDLPPLEDLLQLINNTREIQDLLFYCEPSAYLDPEYSPPPVSANTILSTLSISVPVNTPVIPCEQADDHPSATPHLSLNETCSAGDMKEKDSCGDAEAKDRLGCVDEQHPQSCMDQGLERHAGDTHGNTQNEILHKEANGHPQVCENPVNNRTEPEARVSSVEDPGLSSLQSSLTRTASPPVNTLDNCSSLPPLTKDFPKSNRIRYKKTDTDTEDRYREGTREALRKSQVDAELSGQPNNTAPKEASRYACSVCGKAFYYKKNLTQHQKTHREERPHVCTRCGKTFRNKGHLNDHVCLHTVEPPCEDTEESNKTAGEELRYKCSECGKAFFYKKFLTQHQKNHSSERPYVCSYCGKRFKNKGNLSDHVRLHTGERPFVCSVCGKTFTQSASLSWHKRLHTGARPVNSSCQREAVTSSSGGPGVSLETYRNGHKMNSCERTDHRTENDCPVSSSREQQAPPSSAEGSRVSPPQGSLAATASQPVNTAEDSATQPVQQACADLGKTDTAKRTASPETRFDPIGAFKHQSTHTVDEDHVCSYCGKTFKHIFYLNDHMSLHTSEGAFVCTVCGKAFNKSSYLMQHKRLHTDERPFLCSYCGKAYALKSSLLNHRCVYQGELPYSCSICGKRFSQSSSVAPHMRLHTGERPFLCSVCGKGFTTSGALKVHTRGHTGERPYKCEICGKGFIQSGKLVEHRRVHTGEKPYSCSVCNHQFNAQTKLTRHMKTHTGEKRHECLKCGKRFTRKSHVREHQRVHK